MVLKKIVLPILVLCSFHSIGQDTKNYRKYVNDYLNIGADARGIAMSKSVLGSTQDASATYWNPALLSLNDYKLGVSTMYAEYVGGLSKYNFISLSRKLNNQKTAIGFTYIRLGTDNIPNTLYLVDDDGNVDYGRVSYFSAADRAYLLSLSQKLGRDDSSKTKKALGVNLKFISRRADNFAKAWGIGLDVSFTLQRPKTSFSVVLRDATTTIVNWDINFTQEQIAILNSLGNVIPDKSYEISKPSIMLGFEKTFTISPKFDWKLATNIINTIDGRRTNSMHLGSMDIDPNLGTELGYNNKIFLRGGIGNFQDQSVVEDSTQTIRTYSPSLGAGVQLGKFSIDYALSKFESTSNVPYSHFISLSVRLDGHTAKPFDAVEKEEHDEDDINRINIRK